MNYLLIYIISIIVAVGMINYGKRKNLTEFKKIGVLILFIDVVIPVVSFFAGFIVGINST